MEIENEGKKEKKKFSFFCCFSSNCGKSNSRRKSKNNPSAQLNHDIPKMLKEIIDSHFYESDYNNVTKKLLYEDVSYEEAIGNGIAKVADMDIFEYKKILTE